MQKICLELHSKILGSEKTEFVKQQLAAQGFQLDPQQRYANELFFSR